MPRMTAASEDGKGPEIQGQVPQHLQQPFWLDTWEFWKCHNNILNKIMNMCSPFFEFQSLKPHQGVNTMVRVSGCKIQPIV